MINIKAEYKTGLPDYLDDAYKHYSRWHDELHDKIREKGDKMGFDTSTENPQSYYLFAERNKDNDLGKSMFGYLIELSLMEYNFIKVWDILNKMKSITIGKEISVTSVDEFVENRYELPY